jgi:hypothetical protein
MLRDFPVCQSLKQVLDAFQASTELVWWHIEKSQETLVAGLGV